MNASLDSQLDDDCTAPLEESVAPPLPAAFIPGEPSVTEAGRSAPLQWLPGRVLGSRYRIDRILQVGRMSTVYAATQLDLSRRVAIKVLTAECVADSPGERSLEHEALALAGLQHPHIVSVFEFGRTGEGVAFMAMEFVEGPTLRDHLRAERTLPWRLAVTLAAQIADALAVAHAAGVVHGDVSATNVLLTRRSDLSVTKLIDFGAARRVSDDALPHRTYGTPRYVAPELLGSQPPHFSSDLFALGILLREMLGETNLATSPAVLQQLVASMLEVDPRCRPESAAEVARRLRDTLDSHSTIRPRHFAPLVSAEPGDAPPSALRAQLPAARWRRRWMAASLLGAVVVCGLLAYVYERVPVVSPTQISAASAPASAPQVALLRTEPAPVLRATARSVPPPPPPPVRKRTALTAPVAVAGPRRVPAARLPVTGVPAAVTATLEQSAHGELLSDESIERARIIASLDSWFNARNQNADGERGTVVAMRLGEPRIAFDPTGTSASVTYRKRLSDGRSDRVERSIVDEQVFFAKRGETWEIVDSDGS